VEHVPSISAHRRPPVRLPKPLLSLRSDERLIDLVRAGDPGAFAVLYQRHVAGVLSFCRHMLGSQEEAEEVVERTFASARLYVVGGGREIAFRPWIYTIASNRCLAMLRVRRDQSVARLSTAGLGEEAASRDDLRELLESLQALPAEQRAALVLTELRRLSLAEVADVLGLTEADVKGLVFRARTALVERQEVEGLASLDAMRRQRKLLGLALPVAPSAALDASVMSASGIGAGSAAGAGAGAAAAGGAGAGAGVGAGAVAAGGGGVAAVGAPLLGGAVAKMAVVAALAGGAVATEAARPADEREDALRAPADVRPGGMGDLDERIRDLRQPAVGRPAVGERPGTAGNPAASRPESGALPGPAKSVVDGPVPSAGGLPMDPVAPPASVVGAPTVVPPAGVPAPGSHAAPAADPPAGAAPPQPAAGEPAPADNPGADNRAFPEAPSSDHRAEPEPKSPQSSSSPGGRRDIVPPE
jgi:RNA polymerase sigma factor (sigma-70 family)